MLRITGQLTLQSYTVHGESSGQLGGHFHAATNQGLSKHVLEGLVKVGAVAQFANHGDSILMGQTQNVINEVANTTHLINNTKTAFRKMGNSVVPQGATRIKHMVIAPLGSEIKCYRHMNTASLKLIFS